MLEDPPKPRNAERKAVRMPASCRTANGLRDDGWLEDISAVGCCFVTRGTCFKIGNHVVLRPGGLQGITGIVRWVRANRCGVEFSAPLYPAVLDHLCAQFSGAASSVQVEAAPSPYQPAPSHGGGHPLRRRMF
jgi:hypothetical protein